MPTALEEFGIDPVVTLAKIREEARPLINIHTGPLSELADKAPIASQANELIREWLADPGNSGDPGMNCHDLEKGYVELAAWFHSMSWKYTQDDAEAFELHKRLLYEMAMAGSEGAKRFLPHIMTTDAFNAFSWHAKWYHHGCQSIEIDDKYAASLCATKVAPSELEYVRLPWPCFILRAPKFLQNLIINGEPLRHILVHVVHFRGKVTVSGDQEIKDAVTDTDQYRLQLLTANKYRILPTMSLAQWAEPRPTHSYNDIQLVEVEYGEVDQRQLEIVGRLVLGAMIAMNDEKAHRRYGTLAPGKKPSIGSPRYGTPDEVILHKIGKPVKVDARETIGLYVTGRASRRPNVRTLVAGHWKNQPHGPKSTLRRWQHIECYWRGDEDAPRIIRPHVLSGEG